MIRYTSNKQLQIEEFAMPFEGKLDNGNRWVQMAEQMPWDELAGIYYKNMNSTMGAPSVDARIIIGAVIIKHRMKLDDRGTIEMIQENPYMQYFLGLSGFTSEPVFDPSLFVSIRKRLGNDQFDLMNQELIARAEAGSVKKNKGTKKQNDQPSSDQSFPPAKNKGKMQIDATVADAVIKYPTDLGLLNDSREKSEELIDKLCKRLELPVKPRTYRKEARKRYLLIAKKKNKNKKEVHRAIGEQLRFLKRNINHLYKLLDHFDTLPFKKKEDQKYFFVIQHVFAQQQEMYKEKKHSVANRIVSIHQPHVRPIVRGKSRSDVEFGAKIGVSLQDGFSRVDTISWEAYNEQIDLQKQIENYKSQRGYYPELVQVDRIYLNRDNRAWLKERNIRYTGKPLGRPVQQVLTAYQKRKARKEQAERNWIEGKFGQGKNGYRLNYIRARLQKTSESWIAAIFFVMNLIKFSKELFLSFIFSLKISVQNIICQLDRVFRRNKTQQYKYAC